MRKPAIILAAAALVLSGCESVNEDAVEASGLACPEGSDCYDEVRPVGPGSEFSVVADDFFFEQDGDRSDDADSLTIFAVEGDVTVMLDNQGSALHNFRVDETVVDSDAEKKVEAPAGGEATGALPLFSGTYIFYCDIGDHRALGMEATLVVESEAQREQRLAEEGEEGEPGEPGEEPDEPDGEGDASPSDETSPAEDASPTDDETTSA